MFQIYPDSGLGMVHLQIFKLGLFDVSTHYYVLSNQRLFIRCYRSAYRLKPGSLKSELHESNKSGK